MVEQNTINWQTMNKHEGRTKTELSHDLICIAAYTGYTYIVSSPAKYISSQYLIHSFECVCYVLLS